MATLASTLIVFVLQVIALFVLGRILYGTPFPHALGSLVALPEVHAVRPELQGRVDVVVDDEGRVEPSEGGSRGHDLLGRRVLEPELEDRRAGLDGPRGRVEVGHDRVQDHDSFSRPSRRRFAS